MYACRAQSRKKLFLIVCLCALPSLLWIPYQILQLQRRNCSDSNTIAAILEVCELYYAKKISGSLCSGLCDLNQFSYSYCGNDADSEKTVLIMDYKGHELGEGVNKVVVKVGVNREDWRNKTDEILYWSDSLETKLGKTRQLLKTQLFKFLGSDRYSGNDLLAMVLGKEMSDILSNITSAGNTVPFEESNAMIRTAVALALQNEYLKILALKEYKIAPDIYGVCGPVYFLEHTPSINLLGHTLPLAASPSEVLNYRLKSKPWHERVKVALDLMETVRRTEIGDSLEICDIQTRNAGINSDGRIVFYDLDYTRYGMAFENRTCDKDRTCNLGCCEGYCDTARRKCSRERKNNNLQAVCDKLFLSIAGFGGILRFPPFSVRKELNSVPRRCVHPSVYYNESRSNKAGTDIAGQLETVLKRSIEE